MDDLLDAQPRPRQWRFRAVLRQHLSRPIERRAHVGAALQPDQRQPGRLRIRRQIDAQRRAAPVIPSLIGAAHLLFTDADGAAPDAAAVDRMVTAVLAGTAL